MYKIGDPYFLYMAECEGYIDTKKGKMMWFILRYLEGDNITLEDAGLDYNELSWEDLEFIEDEIRRRSPSYVN